MKFATVESLTGGNLASLMTNHNGSSKYYIGGIVCYSESLKKSLLNVQQQTIDQGYDSSELALELLSGAQILIDADVTISTTGYIESRFAYAFKIGAQYYTYTYNFTNAELKLSRSQRQIRAATKVLQHLSTHLPDNKYLQTIITKC
jgi:PncC family amidohydrolase